MPGTSDCSILSLPLSPSLSISQAADGTRQLLTSAQMDAEIIECILLS